MARYASHEWLPFRHNGGPYTGGPRKLALHRTEGASAAGAFAAYADGGVPHFTWELPSWGNGGRKWQHIDTGIAASALRNDSGGVQTNRDGAVQVEIVGFSRDTRHLSDLDLQWLGEAIDEVCDTEGIDINNRPPFYDEKSGFTLATKNARQRMSYADWEAFNGVCGHQHVPENTHWDPGALDYERMLSLIDQEDHMSAEDVANLHRAVRSDLLRLASFVMGGRTNAVFNHQTVQDAADNEPGIANITSLNELERLLDQGRLELISAAGAIGAGVGKVDPAEVAKHILAGLDPAVIAAAIPDTLASEVADELAARLAG